MKQFTYLLSIVFFTTISLHGQIQQVSVGASYSQQAYYNIETGQVTQVPNDAWDIAFSNDGIQDAGIFINESSSLMTSSLLLFVADETDWSNPITDESVFADSLAIFNPEMNWTEGAFNSIKDPNSPFDYGWGAYNPSSHMIEGNKIFVIKKRNGSFLKMQVLQLVGGEYTFRYADLDGKNEVIAIASKNQAGNNPLIYFSFESGQGVEIPNDYDLVFQRYTSALDDGTGNLLEYVVTGVLLGPNTQAVVADGVDPLLVMESDYSNDYSFLPTTIGHEWKFFDFTSGWVIDEDRVTFVKTKNDKVFKLVFYDFEGSSTGITTFEKREVEITSSIDTPLNDLDISIYPNPTSDFLFIDGATEKYKLYLMDYSGNLVLNTDIVSGKSQISLHQIPSGMYNLILVNKNTVANQSIIVSK